MRALDTNILVYAHRAETPNHREALELVKGLAEGSEPWALSWTCVYEFLRVVTHPRVFHPPTSPSQAWGAVKHLLASPSLRLISEGGRHSHVLDGLLASTTVVGNLYHDAHIACLLLEHGVHEILTADEDFRRFPGLRVVNPFRS
jgi:uncharacterized protein